MIDLENFYLAREENCGVYAASELSQDLEHLTKFVADFAAGRRVTVQRAYANYSTARQAIEVGRWDFFLQKASKALMERGIEPVQVFRFPGGGNKNAADMRIAMDATVIASENPRIEQCILVTGDADFIPLILDLKRRGIQVAVIGVRAHTKMLLERYCDQFELFEDLLAARDFDDHALPQLEVVKTALHAVLARRQPLSLAAIKPLLGRELGVAFDASRFGCEGVAEFVRTYADKLGVVTVQGADDWEVRLESPSAPAAPVSERVVEPATPQHTPALYHKLLRFRRPNLHVLPRAEWELITQAIYSLAVGAGGEALEIEHQKLLDAATDLCEQGGLQLAYIKVNGTLFQVFKSGCFVCASDGPEQGRGDFHWGLSAKLLPEIRSVEQLRRRVRSYVVQSLKTRLEAIGIETAIDPSALAEYLDGPRVAPEHVDELKELITASSGGWAVGV